MLQNTEKNFTLSDLMTLDLVHYLTNPTTDRIKVLKNKMLQPRGNTIQLLSAQPLNFAKKKYSNFPLQHPGNVVLIF